MSVYINGVQVGSVSISDMMSLLMPIIFIVLMMFVIIAIIKALRK
jgi:hypothetical protein